MGIAKKDQRGSEQDDNFCTRGLKKKQALNTIAGEWGFNRVGRQDCENSYVPHEVGAKGLGYYECVYNATGEEKCKPFRPVLMCVRFFRVFLIVWVTWNLLGAAVGFQRDESTYPALSSRALPANCFQACMRLCSISCEI